VKVLLLMLAFVFTLYLAELAFGHARWKHEPGELRAPLVHETGFFRSETWRLQDAMSVPRFPSVYAERRTQGDDFRLWLRELWRDRLERARARYGEWQASAPAVGGVWAALAECESGGDWSYNGSSGYDGGLQFDPGTWSSNAPAGYPVYAWQASPAQQIAVAEIVLAAAGWDQWPACSAQLGLR
jgi:Transglycosylase-like domain